MPTADKEEIFSFIAPTACSGEGVFSLAARVAVAALETHPDANAAQGKKSHQGDFSKNRALRVGKMWAKWPGTHQDSKSSWSENALGPALDSNGNTTSKTDSSGTTSYTWDYENRLTSVTLPGSAGTATFKYDPFGRRIEKISPTTTSIFAYDGDNLIETTNGSGSEVASYTQTQNIDEPLAMLRGTTKDYYEADGVGSITSLSNPSGALDQSYTYDSFGNTTNSSGSLTNFFRYTGREFDTETNLYYYRNRYYDPSTGRFLSEDPVRFRGGIDFYPYAANSPANFNDPFGLEPQGCTDCQGKPTQGVAAGKKCCSNADPLANSAPDPYPSKYFYRGVSAQFMFQNGGNGPWGNIVRGCLVCMYNHGSDPNSAHLFCYLNGFHRTTTVQGLSGLGTAVGEAGSYLVFFNPFVF